MPASVINWSLTRGVIVGPQRVNLLSFPVNVDRSQGLPTQLVSWSPAGARNAMIAWEAKTLCFAPRPAPHLLIIEPFGEAKVFSPAGIVDAPLRHLPNGPLERGPLLDSRFIGEHIYVAGMHRQLYRRHAEADPSVGQWTRCDAGLVLSTPSADVVGICSVDGFSEDEMYAVGWQGEIWFGKPDAWSAVPALTNLKLERVVCAPNGYAYAIGQAGLILKGRGDQWAVIAHELTTDKFWGCAWFADRLWICSRERLYALDAADNLLEVSDGLPESPTFGWLDADASQLWSFGASTLMYAGDDLSWHQVVLESSPAGP